MEYIGFDLNKECGGGRFDRITKLLEMIEPNINNQGFGHYHF